MDLVVSTRRLFVTDIDKCLHNPLHKCCEFAHKERVPEAILGCGASAVPARGLASRTRAASGIIWPALRPVREVRSLDWD